MGKIPNKKCYCCGIDYYYCTTCPTTEHLETWHIMFHDENCKKIFQICCDDFTNTITREETLRLLAECDLSNLENFNTSIKNQIKEILASKPVEVTSTIESEVVTEEVATKSFLKKKKG